MLLGDCSLQYHRSDRQISGKQRPSSAIITVLPSSKEIIDEARKIINIIKAGIRKGNVHCEPDNAALKQLILNLPNQALLDGYFACNSFVSRYSGQTQKDLAQSIRDALLSHL